MHAFSLACNGPTVKFSKRAAGCLGGTVREGGGRLPSALSVGYTQSLACFRQVAESAETVEVIIPHLVGSKTGGICCYSTQSGSTHLPLSPGSEGKPAIRPWFSPDKDPFAPFVFEGPTKKPVPGGRSRSPPVGPKLKFD